MFCSTALSSQSHKQPSTEQSAQVQRGFWFHFVTTLLRLAFPFAVISTFSTSARPRLIKKSFVATLGWLLVVSALSVHATISVERMRCEYLVDPLGVNETQPRLDWLLTDARSGLVARLWQPVTRDLTQKSYRILVASSADLLAQNKGDLWDSGEVASDATNQIVYGGSALVSRERCYWKVQVRDSAGDTVWSKPAFWEMGLLKPGDWQAKWIDSENLSRAATLDGPLSIVSASYEAMDGAGARDVTGLVRGLVKDNKLSVTVGNIPMGADPAQNHVKQLRIVYTTGGDAKHSISAPENATLSIPAPDQNVPYLRKDFTLTKPVAKARLYATALGLYELHLNGKRVGDHIFAPDWTDYSKRVRYQDYDVTSMVKPGANTWAGFLGNGWYAGHIGNGGYQAWGKVPALFAQLEVTYQDGSVERIVTDGSWKTHPGPITSADFMLGENYDAQLEIPGWDEPGLDTSTWTPASERAEASREIDAQIDQPVRETAERHPKLLKQVNGRWIYDLGQNMVGFVRLKVSEPKGTVITLRHAEMLAADGTIYTANLRGAPSIDTYTCRGGGVETWQPHFTFHGFRYIEISGLKEQPPEGALTGIVIGTDFPRTGEFASSYAPINQLQSNIQWGMRGNYLSVPTDCPQRDERMGWMGDAEVFCRTATYNGDVAAFFTKWMVDVDDAQKDDGEFTDVSPSPQGQGGGNGGVPAWGDAGVIIPVTIYRMYGDTRILQKHLANMKRWVDWCQAHSTNLIRDHDRGPDYGDWLSQGEDTPKDLIGTAFFGYSTGLLAEACDAVGDVDAPKYHQLFNDIKAVFTQKYVQPDGHMTGDTQSGYAMAVRFNLVSDDLKPKIAQLLADNIARHQDHLTSGFVGVSYLLPVLCQYGHVAEAYKLFEQDTFPSWLFSVKNGATTIWERWDGWRPDKGFQNPGMNSFNHYSLGSCGEWMYDTVAGIDLDPAAPAFKHIIIHPTPGGTLTEADAIYDSINGEITTKWTLHGSAFALHVTIPINTTAKIDFPAMDDPNTLREDGKGLAIRVIRNPGQPVRTSVDVGSGDYNFTCQTSTTL
jgi:alpha-L-rhamnosidase